MKAIYMFLTINQSSEMFVANKSIRAIEVNTASLIKVCNNASLDLTSQVYSGEVSRIARLEGYYKNGVEYSLSAN
jgi:hypothetical protein